MGSHSGWRGSPVGPGGVPGRGQRVDGLQQRAEGSPEGPRVQETAPAGAPGQALTRKPRRMEGGEGARAAPGGPRRGLGCGSWGRGAPSPRVTRSPARRRCESSGSGSATRWAWRPASTSRARQWTGSTRWALALWKWGPSRPRPRRGTPGPGSSGCPRTRPSSTGGGCSAVPRTLPTWADGVHQGTPGAAACAARALGSGAPRGDHLAPSCCVLCGARSCLPSPEPCPPRCRYGFNSHGHAAVERRLRARQKTQLRLTGGETSS